MWGCSPGVRPRTRRSERGGTQEGLRAPAGRAPSNDGGNHQPAWRVRLWAPGSYSAVIRADKRGNAAISPLANLAGLGRRLVDVAVANHCTRRPGDGRRLLGPASIRSPPFTSPRAPTRTGVTRTGHEKRPLNREGAATPGISTKARGRRRQRRHAREPWRGRPERPAHASATPPARHVLMATPPGRASALRGVESEHDVRTRSKVPSHFGLRLTPAKPVLIVGVSRRC